MIINKENFAVNKITIYIENQIVNKKIKLNTYVRYIDDIFHIIDNEKQLAEVKQIFENISGLKFIFEKEMLIKISFLDVIFERKDNIIEMSDFIREILKNCSKK